MLTGMTPPTIGCPEPQQQQKHPTLFWVLYAGPHPLDPLTEDEVRRAAAACRAHAAVLGLPPLRFNTISLQEPPKHQLLQYQSGTLQQLPRLSLCILQTPPQFVVYEATVNLQPQHSTDAAAAVVSWAKVSPAVDRSAGSQPSHNPETTVAQACAPLCAAAQHAPPALSEHNLLGLPPVLTCSPAPSYPPAPSPAPAQLEGLDGQPLTTPDDCLEAEAIARSDARVQAMVAQRGVALDKVACDPWAIHACPPEWQGRRLMQVCHAVSVRSVQCCLCPAWNSPPQALCTRGLHLLTCMALPHAIHSTPSSQPARFLSLCLQVFMYYKACPDDNEYAHPMDLCPIVDLNEQRVSRHRRRSMRVSGTCLCCRTLPAL